MEFGWAKSAEPALSALIRGQSLSPDNALLALRALTGAVAAELLSEFLGKAIKYYPTNRHGGDWKAGQPEGWVDHYTAADSTRSTLIWFSSRERPGEASNSSAHFVISPEGIIVTVVNPLTTVAWHASSANPWALGAEHVNCGALYHAPVENPVEMPEKFFYLEKIPYHVDWKRPPAYIDGKFWEPFTTAQVISNIALKRLCRAAMPTLRREKFTQHSAVSPGRKIDCGPMWPLEQINDLAFSNANVSEFASLKKPFMNIAERDLFCLEAKEALSKETRDGH